MLHAHFEFPCSVWTSDVLFIAESNVYWFTCKQEGIDAAGTRYILWSGIQ